MNEQDGTQLDRLARDIFLEAVEIQSPEGRAKYLQNACQSAPLLRARVEALLQAHAKDSFLEGAVMEDLPTALSSLVTRETEGTLIARYKLLEKLGEGGFGTVWLAEQKVPVRRKVALKIIKPGMDTHQVVARFEAERQALAMMDHPNIAKVLDAGETDNGRPYFVMELVRGVPVTKFCDEQCLSASDRLDLIIKICQAVQHAHQKGIIHRDIKPSNVMVTLHDGVAVPKVIDFGIAKATQGELTDKTIHTRFQQFIGTPAYMSPEQAEMSGLDIDTRSDIYSLGVLLYELLTGNTPLDGGELLAAGLDEMRRTIREKEPLRPSTRLETLQAEELTSTAKRRATDAPKLIHLLRGDLDWIVMKCLEKDRTRRYETANGLAADLKRYLSNEPVVARPPSRAYRIRKMVRRNKLAFATAAAIAVVLILGTTVSTWQAVRATSAQREEGKQRHAAQEAQQSETQQRLVAEEAGRLLRQTLYVSDIAVAWQSWAEGDAERARERLDRYRPRPTQTNDLRGFEWRYLWRVSRPRELMIVTNPCAAAKYSPDGRILAISSGANPEGGIYRLLDTASQKQLRVIKAYEISSWGVGFSPDSRLLVAASRDDPDVKLYDVQTGELSGKLTATNQETFRGVFSPDGKRIATVAASAYTRDLPPELKIWDAKSLRELFELKGHKYWVVALDFSPDSKFAATVDGEGLVKLWDLEARKELRTLRGHRGFGAALKFSPIGKIVATSDQYGTIILWDWETGDVLRILTGHQGPIYDLAFSRDGKRLASAGQDHTARLWDTETGEPTARFLGHSDRIWTVDLSPDGQTLVTAGGDGTVRFWRVAPTAESEVSRPVGSLGFSPDSRFLFEDDWGRETETLKDPSTLAIVRTLPGKDLKFSDTGRLLGIVRNKTDIVICQTDTMRELKTIKGSSEISLRAFAPNGRFVVFLRANRTIISDLEQTREVADLGGNFDQHLFTTNSKRLVAIDSDNNRVQIWDADGWRVRGILDGHGAKVTSLAVSPDGQMLATGSEDSTVRLWDLETHRAAPYALLRGNGGSITAVAFSPDGKTLAAGGYGGAIELWSVPGRQQFGALKGHLSRIMHLEFSPDCRTLLSQSYDGTMRLWRAPLLEEIESSAPVQNHKTL